MLLNVFLFVCGLSLCKPSEVAWRTFENSFKNANREEIFISSVTTDQNFQSNYTVQKWKTLNMGNICYSGGLINDTLLVILFSTLSLNSTGFDIIPTVFELKNPAREMEFFYDRKDGKDEIFIALYMPEKRVFEWYSLKDYFLTKIWTWSLDKDLVSFDLFKMGNKNMLISTTTDQPNNRTVAILYQFKTYPFDFWLYQYIPLSSPPSSVSVNIFQANFYLSIPQTSLNQIQIHKLVENHFIPYKNLTSGNADQVVSFENGFKSFLAINGFNAGIYQFTKDGLVKETIVNSNLEGIQFWLAIPVETYRDETILLAQRKLDHGSHFSLDVDVVTYNGNRFEEHEDIPCSLFGELENGLKCFTEYDPGTGILGATYIAVRDRLGFLVPKLGGASLLFNVDIGVREVEHPRKQEIEMLLEHKERFEKMMDNQKKEYERLLAQRKSLSQQEELDSTKSDSLVKESPKSPKNILDLKDEVEKILREIEDLNKKVENSDSTKKNNGKFRTVTFNGVVEVEGELTSKKVNTSLIGEEDATHLINDIVSRDQLKHIAGHKTFDDLTVTEINFGNVNGIPKSSFIIKNDGIVKIDENVVFGHLTEVENVIVLSGFVNNVHVDKEWIRMDTIIDSPLAFEQLSILNTFHTTTINNITIPQTPIDLSSHQNENFNIKDDLDSVLIPGNLTVGNINGQNFEEFLKKLCLRNIRCHIPKLKVKGDFNITHSAIIEYLNGLQYPKEYVLSESSDEMLTITGVKNFTNTVRGYKITSESNTINNIDLDKFISLSSAQNISGNLTFNDLEVESVLTVSGNIRGRDIENYLPNLGLKETKRIKANVEFLNIEVQGSIIIENNFNDVKFIEYLEDFIYKDEDTVTINGHKNLSEGFTVRQNLHIISNTINNISLDSLITKDTNQNLEVDSILGTVNFDHLRVKGLFDKQNVTELNDTIVRVKENNKEISSVFVFSDLLEVDNLVIEELNGLKPEEYLEKNVTSDRFASDDVVLGDVEVERLIVEGNFNGIIEDFDLDHLSQHYLSYTKDQDIVFPYYADRLVVSRLSVTKLNDLYYDDVFSYDRLLSNVSDLLKYKNPTINTLNVDGSVTLNNVNGKHFRSLLNNHVWMKLNKEDSGKVITVDGDVYFESLQVQKLAGVGFDRYVETLVYKDETNFQIENSVTFKNGIIVKSLLETKTLNNIKLENVLRKEGTQEIAGPIKIYGDVTIKNELEVQGMINDVYVKYILDSFDVKHNFAVFKGEVMFQRLAYVKSLIVNGSINGRNIEDISSKFVYLNEDVDLEDDIVFMQSVDIRGNLAITNNLNGINLAKFVPQIVWITQDTDIGGPVRFTDSVDIQKHLKVDKSINTQYLFGEVLEDHVNEAVFINKGYLEGSYNFDELVINDFLNTKFLNNLNMSLIIPLKTNQVIDFMDIDELEVANDVTVKNRVNGVELFKEKENSFMSNLDQKISSEIVFLNNVLIEENLIAPTINNKPTEKIVTTNTDQNLTATYSFNTKCWTKLHVNVHGFLNGINITLWAQENIPIYSEEVQNIDEEWTIVENVNFLGSVEGDGMINGINMTNLVRDVQEKKNNKCDMEKGIITDYKNLCTDVTYIYEKTRHQIYKFKYFEQLQKFSLPNHVHFIKHFERKGDDYLLINEDSCLSHLMVLKEGAFYPLKSIHTGTVTQVEVIEDKDDLLLVTRGDESKNVTCRIRFSTVVWKWINEDLEVLASIETQELLQNSRVPLTFYGLKNGVVTEFKIEKFSERAIKPYRKWEINEDAVTFLPRGLQTGLTLTSQKHLFFLDRTEPVVDDDFSLDTEAVIIGNVTKEQNIYIPGRQGGDVTITNVGVRGAKKSLLAVASHRESRVQHRLDLVEIYLDPIAGELFDQIPTYKPSSLVSVEFENGETLLVFLEDRRNLQIYEYRGIEGFKHRSTVKLAADDIFLMALPLGRNLKPKKVLGLVHKNDVTLIQAVMVGNKIKDDLKCSL